MPRSPARTLTYLAALLMIPSGCCTRPQGRISESDVLTNQWEVRRNVNKVVVVTGILFVNGKSYEPDYLALPGGIGQFGLTLDRRLPESSAGKTVTLEGTATEGDDGHFHLERFKDVSSCLR